MKHEVFGWLPDWSPLIQKRWRESEYAHAQLEEGARDDWHPNEVLEREFPGCCYRAVMIPAALQREGKNVGDPFLSIWQLCKPNPDGKQLFCKVVTLVAPETGLPDTLSGRWIEWLHNRERETFGPEKVQARINAIQQKVDRGRLKDKIDVLEWGKNEIADAMKDRKYFIPGIATAPDPAPAPEAAVVPQTPPEADPAPVAPPTPKKKHKNHHHTAPAPEE